MGYGLFTEYLRTETARSITLTTEQIKAIIEKDLPPTAFTWEAWWSNSDTHPLAAAWLAAGWRRPRGGLVLGHQVTLEREFAPGPVNRDLPARGVNPTDRERALGSSAFGSVRVPADWRDLLEHAVHVEIQVERDADGAVKTYQPQSRYANAEDLALNHSGAGSFCRFSVRDDVHRAGVYLIVADGRLAYVGECADFSSRFNDGYGRISPRNCFERGQEQNCHVNRRILGCASRGWQVDVYFIARVDRKALEARLIRTYDPPWNRAK